MPLGSEVEEVGLQQFVAPPLGHRLLYELYGHRLPPRHQAWVERDIRSSGWAWRRYIAIAVPYLIGPVAVAVAMGAPRYGFFPWLVGLGAIGGVSLARRNQQRERYLRHQRGEGPELPMWEKRAIAVLAAVAVVAVAFAVVYRHRLTDALNPHRCTTPPVSTRAAIAAAAEPGVTFSSFQQRRQDRWTGIAAIVGPNRIIGTWVEDRSVTPHRISAADTYAFDQTRGLPPLMSGPDFTDAVNAARSAVTCRILTP